MIQSEKLLVARCAVRVSHLGQRASRLRPDANRKGASRRLVSDEVQIRAAADYCQRQGLIFDEDASVQGIDHNVSGSSTKWRDRPGLRMHYEDAKLGRFQVLCCYDLTRIGRDLADSLDLVKAFQNLGVSVISVLDGLTLDDEADELPAHIRMAVAQSEAKRIGRRIRDAARLRAEDGRLHGGSLPAWIVRDGERLQLNPEQAAAFRRLVELRIQGRGETKIAKALNQEGFKTAKGAAWRASMVHKYLQETWIDSMLGTGYYGRDDETRRIAIPDAFPPLLEVSQAEALRAALRVQRRPSRGIGHGNWKQNRPKGRISASSPYLLSGLVRCPYCGGSMFGSKKGKCDGERMSYACPMAPANPDLHPNWCHSIATHLVEDAVLRVVRHVLQVPPEPIERPPILPVVDVAQIEDKLVRLTEQWLDGHVSEIIYQRLKAQFEAQMATERRAAEAHAAPLALSQSIKLMAEPDRDALRQVVLLLVESVEAPVVFAEDRIRANLEPRSGARGLRRYARVKLRHPTTEGQTYLAPIYRANWAGPRMIRVEGAKREKD